MNQPTAIITGASQGLGLAMAEILCSKSYHVVGVHRGNSSDSRWTALVNSGAAKEILGSAGLDRTVDEAFKAAKQTGQLDLVINCAGVGVFGPAGTFTRSAVDEVFEANLIGTILFSEKAFNILKDRGGVIVNVMSTAATVGRPNEVIYCAAKWGARGYTESLRLEAKGTKAHVISVFPGGMDTPFWRVQTGATTDSSKFMAANEVATVLADAITRRASLYVSDITINRI